MDINNIFILSYIIFISFSVKVCKTIWIYYLLNFYHFLSFYFCWSSVLWMSLFSLLSICHRIPLVFKYNTVIGQFVLLPDLNHLYQLVEMWILTAVVYSIFHRKTGRTIWMSKFLVQLMKNNNPRKKPYFHRLLRFIPFVKNHVVVIKFWKFFKYY